MSGGMKICVSGWYFFDELLPVLAEANKKYPVTFVTYDKRAEEMKDHVARVKELGMIHQNIPVCGMEYGTYDWFLKFFWDNRSRVFYMHDDIQVTKVETFDTINELSCDQAYIFRDEYEEKANGRIHGRGVYTSKEFQDFLLSYYCACKHAFDGYDKHNPEHLLKGTGVHNGFWYDPWNDGKHTQGKVPPGYRHYNCGVYHFHYTVTKAVKAGLNANNKVHIWDFDSARRGKMNYVRRPKEEGK